MLTKLTLNATSPGDQPEPPRLPHGLLAIIFSIGATLGSGLAYGFSQVRTNNQAPSTAQAELQGIRLAEYERVELGMSLAEVQATLGRGTETSRSTTIATFVWKNSDGSGITAIFEKGRLKSKEQSGLK